MFASSPCEPRVHEISQSPPPVFHLLLWFHTAHITIGISHLVTSQLPSPRFEHFPHEILIGYLANNTSVLADVYQRSTLMGLEPLNASTITSFHLSFKEFDDLLLLIFLTIFKSLEGTLHTLLAENLQPCLSVEVVQPCALL
jgi:hypothetical protein